MTKKVICNERDESTFCCCPHYKETIWRDHILFFEPHGVIHTFIERARTSLVRVI